MPPPVPISPMIARMMSLAVTPGGTSPSTSIAIHFGRDCGNVWVASTCSTSLVPMPNASAPNAPWVAVWLSPQTIVVPGSVRPCSGPMTWTMPWFGSPIGYSVMPNSAALARIVSTCLAEIGSAIGWSMSAVGTLWSSVATVSSGRRTVRPLRRKPVKRLRAGDLVDEVEVDVQQVGFAGRGSAPGGGSRSSPGACAPSSPMSPRCRAVPDVLSSLPMIS